MNNYPDTEEEIEDGHSIDLLALFFKYLSYWKIFLASVAVCMIISVINLKRTTPLYHVTTKVLLKDDKKGGVTAELGPLKELGMSNAKNNVDNEMEVLKTSNLSEVVVRELGLYVTYSEKGTFRNKNLYGDDCPVRISLSDTYLDTLKHSLGFEAVVGPTGLEFKGKYRDQDYLVKATFNDSRVVLPFGTVYINKALPVKNAMTVDISIQKPAGVAKGLLGAMTMELTSKTTSVVDIILTTPNIEQGKDFLFKLIEVYNREDMKDQNQVAYNT